MKFHQFIIKDNNLKKDREEMRIVYSYYVLGIVHQGHLAMMRNAKSVAGEDGKLIVGILTDEAVMEKRQNQYFPLRKEWNLRVH